MFTTKTMAKPEADRLINLKAKHLRRHVLAGYHQKKGGIIISF